MKKNFALALTKAAPPGTMPLRSACDTAQGTGHDLQAAGRSLANITAGNTLYPPQCQTHYEQ